MFKLRQKGLGVLSIVDLNLYSTFPAQCKHVLHFPLPIFNHLPPTSRFSRSIYHYLSLPPFHFLPATFRLPLCISQILPSTPPPASLQASISHLPLAPTSHFPPPTSHLPPHISSHLYHTAVQSIQQYKCRSNCFRQQMQYMFHYRSGLTCKGLEVINTTYFMKLHIMEEYINWPYYIIY